MKFNFEITPFSINEPTIIYVNLLNRKDKYPLACIGRDSYIWQGLINTGLEYTIDIGYTTHNIQIGSFTSIDAGLEFCMGINHSYSNLCLGVSKLFEGRPAGSSFNQKGQIIIQNDVWIGHNCTIMPGVIIHDGAVVTAKSHVVNDVPPYAIVGGNPAKVIKYRFNPELINKLLTIKWWNWSNEEIKNKIKCFSKDISKFCDIFYDKYRNERENIKAYEIVKLKENFLFFMDFTDTYNIYERVIEQFINKYKDNYDYQLILFTEKNFAENNADLINEFNRYLDNQIKKTNALCKFKMITDSMDKSRSLFKAVDYYITSRVKETVLYSEYADEFNVKIISGVDTFIFR